MGNTNLDEISTALENSGTNELNRMYLTFWTDRQSFGVPIAEVVQIVGVQEITAIPEYPYYAKGVINMRGLIIPVIDMRLRMGKPEAEYGDRTCIIVTNIRENYYGFVVDEVDEVTDIQDEQISKPPKIAGNSVNQYLTGIGKQENKITLLISTAKILGEEELDILTSGAAV